MRLTLCLVLLTLSTMVSRADDLHYNYFFTEAVKQHVAGNYDAAFDLYTYSLQLNPKSAEAWHKLFIYNMGLGNDSIAMEYVRRAIALNPENNYYQENLAKLYMAQENYPKAIEAFEQLASQHKDRADVLSALLQLYNQNEDYDKMIDVVNRLEMVDGTSEELTLTKMNIYEKKGDQKSAWKALKSLSDEHPNDLSYKVMMGNWLMSHDKMKEAGKIFAQAMKEDPENDDLLSAMYDYYEAKGDSPQARQIMMSLLASPKTSTDTKSTMMRQAIIKNEYVVHGDSTEILRLFDYILQNNPKDADMAEMKAAYMSLKEMPRDSVNKAFRCVLDIAPDNASARVELLQAALQDENWDEAIAQASQGTQYNPDEMVFYYYLGVSHYQKNELDEALDAFRRGLSQINPTSNEEVVADFYGTMGDILYQKGLEEQAFEAYDSCLQWKDDNISALNNYAYYLSLKNTDLQRAEQMSYRTVKAEPQNPTYLDTYAWILFQEERYAEAKIYIEQAIANDTDSVLSSVVLEHAGDIYAMNNDLPKAMEFWQKARENGEGNALLERKIKEQKYVKPEEE